MGARSDFLLRRSESRDRRHRRKASTDAEQVVGWARREGCAAVVVVNLFVYRSTDPGDLFSAPIEIIGDRNDAVIEEHSAAARITLAARGAHRLAQARAKDVIPLLKQPWCVGLTKRGAPAHPLYVPSSRPFQRFP